MNQHALGNLTLFRVRSWSIFLIASVSLFSSCTNNVNFTGQFNTMITGSSPFNPPEEDTTTGAFTLSRVVLDTYNPTSIFSLIGDSTGTFGNLCVSTGSGGGDASTSPTVCECQYTYSTAAAPNQQITTPVIYHEANLLRCSYANLPSGLSSVKVEVHVTTADTYSNPITFKFTGTGGGSLDTTNINSFVAPVRYQCRDIINIKYIFDNQIYDPFQSEDPHLSYPIDFYTSSVGGAISTYVSQNNTDWNCPPILNPTSYLSGTLDDPTSALSLFTKAYQINLKVYSKAPLADGSKLIYPPAGSVDRSTFYLAKSNGGVFSLAVNSIEAPGFNTSHADPNAPNGVSPPLGYGAAPIPIGLGTGKETCPDTSVSIPPGFHWMKLWLFRAGLEQRHFATSGSQGLSLNNVASISCNPGDWDSTPPTPIFPGCAKSIANGGTSTSMRDLTTRYYLADRVINGSGLCFRLDDRSDKFCHDDGGILHPGPSCSSLDGVDSWLVEGAFSPTKVGCTASPLNDPLGICLLNSAGTSFVPTQPHSFNVGTGDLDTESGTARYDFLFVVTPVNIHLTHMQDTSSSSPSLPYQPYRFKSAGDCNSNDPDNAPSGDCLQKNVINTYSLKLHDVGSNGDPPATDPKRPGVFPVCVLQPN